MRFPRSFSLKRYAFDAAVPAAESSEIVRRLGARRFKALTAHEERTYGWVSPENLLITDPQQAALPLGRRVLLAFRIDRRRVNARLLRARVDLEVRARAKAAKDGAGRARITRDERAALRKEIHDELLGQASPSLESHLVLLDPEARTACVLTSSRTANDVFRALFRDTFEAEALPRTPWRPSTAEDARRLAGAALQRSEFVPALARSTAGADVRGSVETLA